MNIKLKAAASLALAAILGSSGAHALTANQTFTQGELRFLVTPTPANKQVLVGAADVKTLAGNVVIPGTITVNDNGESVTLTVVGVGASTYGFKGATKITSVTFPESCVSLATHAFDGCTSLVMDKLPESITSIGTNAFEGCTSITEFELPGYLKTVPNELFRGCTNLQKVTIPSQVTTIGMYAFYNCNSLTEVDLPASLTTIGANAFTSCDLRKVVIPAGVTALPGSVFSSNHNLKEVVLHDGITSIGQYAFNGCRSLESINIPANLESLGYSAFAGCFALKEVTIPGGMTAFGPAAFYNCLNLKKVVFEEGMPDLDNYSGSTTGMNFQNCTALTDVYVNDAALRAYSANNFGTSTYENGMLYLKASAVSSALANAPWNKFANMVKMDDITNDLSMGELSIKEGSKLSHLTMVKVVANAPVVARANAAFELRCDGEVIAKADAIVHNAHVLRGTVYGDFGGVETVAGKTYTVALPEGALLSDNADTNPEVAVSFCGIDEPAEHVNIDLTLGEHATVSHKVAKSQPAVINVTPATDWTLEALTVNGTDVTGDVADNAYTLSAETLAADAQVVATFAYANAIDYEFSTTGVTTIEGCPFTVQADGDVLVINGVAGGAAIKVYNLSGQLLSSTAMPEAGAARIAIAHGTYIVTIGDKTLKIQH